MDFLTAEAREIVLQASTAGDTIIDLAGVLFFNNYETKRAVVATGSGDLKKLQRLLVDAKQEKNKWSDLLPALEKFASRYQVNNEIGKQDVDSNSKALDRSDLVYCVMTHPGIDSMFSRSGITWKILSKTLQETKGSADRAELIEELSKKQPVVEDDDDDTLELIERMQLSDPSETPYSETNTDASPSTSLLAKYGTELVSRAASFDPVIGRDEEVQRSIHILCRRSKRSVCLVGYPGVGKTAIVEEVARRIAQNRVPKILQGCKIWSVNMGSMVSGSSLRGQFEKKMQRLIEELKSDPKAILFLDEIHLAIGAGRAEGGIMDAANLMKPALGRGEIRCIGATTNQEYTEHIEKDLAFARRFILVQVPEPSFDLAVSMLLGLKPLYEKFHEIHIPDEIIRLVVEHAVQREGNTEVKTVARRLPDSAIDLLDESCVSCSSAGKTLLTEDFITMNSRSRL